MEPVYFSSKRPYNIVSMLLVLLMLLSHSQQQSEMGVGCQSHGDCDNQSCCVTVRGPVPPEKVTHTKMDLLAGPLLSQTCQPLAKLGEACAVGQQPDSTSNNRCHCQERLICEEVCLVNPWSYE